MKTREIIIAVVSALALIAACWYISGQKKEISQKETEIQSLKTGLSAAADSAAVFKDMTARQNEELSSIMMELSAIAGRTSNLKIDLESGSAELSTAQQIENSIAAIKKRIKDLEHANTSAAKNNTEFQAVIDNFKKIVLEQEEEINRLKDEIDEKNRTIKSQQVTIDSQLETIAKQNEELELMVANQAKALFEAGMNLEELGDASPKVSWSNNKKKVEAMQQTIYREALVYYGKALEAGYAPAEAKIEEVKAKLKDAQ